MIITRFLIGNLLAWLDWILRQMLLPQVLVMEAGAVPLASGCLRLPPSNLGAAAAVWASGVMAAEKAGRTIFITPGVYMNESLGSLKAKHWNL
jgi:hypothetical protein